MRVQRGKFEGRNPVGGSICGGANNALERVRVFAVALKPCTRVKWFEVECRSMRWVLSFFFFGFYIIFLEVLSYFLWRADEWNGRGKKKIIKGTRGMAASRKSK